MESRVPLNETLATATATRDERLLTSRATYISGTERAAKKQEWSSLLKMSISPRVSMMNLRKA